MGTSQTPITLLFWLADCFAIIHLPKMLAVNILVISLTSLSSTIFSSEHFRPNKNHQFQWNPQCSCSKRTISEACKKLAPSNFDQRYQVLTVLVVTYFNSEADKSWSICFYKYISNNKYWPLELDLSKVDQRWWFQPTRVNGHELGDGAGDHEGGRQKTIQGQNTLSASIQYTQVCIFMCVWDIIVQNIAAFLSYFIPR